MDNTGLRLKLDTFNLSDFLDVCKVDEKVFKLPFVILFERKFDGVNYIFANYHSYVCILAENSLTNNYLPVNGENIELLINRLVCSDNDNLNDALEDKKTKQITVEGDIIDMFDIIESANAIDAFSMTNPKSTPIPAKEYIVELNKHINKAVKPTKLANVNWTMFSSTTKDMLAFGAHNKVKIDSDIDNYVELAIVYFLQLAFTDRARKMQWIIMKIAKSISKDK